MVGKKIYSKPRIQVLGPVARVTFKSGAVADGKQTPRKA